MHTFYIFEMIGGEIFSFKICYSEKLPITDVHSYF